LTNELDAIAKPLLEETDSLITAGLTKALSNIGLAEDATRSLCEFVMISGPPAEFLTSIDNLELPETTVESINELKELSDHLTSFGVIEPVIFDASMARGLDYYTGIVFEAFDSTGEIVRAILGGGRYADLVEAVGGSPLTGVGFGMGETVIWELMKLRDVFDGKSLSSVDLYLAPIKSEPIPQLLKLATRLKKQFKVICNPFSWKIGRHFEFADQKNAKITILLGMRDIDNNVVSVRIMHNSEQLSLAMDEDLEAELHKLLTSIDEDFDN